MTKCEPEGCHYANLRGCLRQLQNVPLVYEKDKTHIDSGSER